MRIVLLAALAIVSATPATPAAGAGSASQSPARTDPLEVTTGDLLFRKGRLDAHLEARRVYLATLSQRLETLDDGLLERQAQLFSLEQELEAVEQPSRELAELLKEIEMLRTDSDQLGLALFRARTDMKELEEQIEAEGLAGEELEAERLAAKARVEALEQRMALVESGIRNALRTRAAQILAEQS